MENLIKKRINKSIGVKQLLLQDKDLIKVTNNIVNLCVSTIKSNNKILFCGNGGSAADAQHLAAELSGRFYINRKPINAEALHVNSSYITAVGNDFGFNDIYSRALQAKGIKGDVLIGLSTSGNSKNILNAFKIAKKMNIHTVGFTGNSDNKLSKKSDFLIAIPSNETPRIQECHMLIGHIICELIESNLFS